VKGDGEEQGEAEVEGVGPEERGKAAQGEGEAVEEDVAVFRHRVRDLGLGIRCEGPGLKPLMEGDCFVGLKPHANPNGNGNGKRKGKGNCNGNGNGKSESESGSSACGEG
jgi:hypothetical protein